MTTAETPDPAPSDIGNDSRVIVTLPTEPRPQSRASILLRPLLVIPFVLLAAIYLFIALVVLIPSWFAALVTGRVPRVLRELSVGYVRYQAELLAYQNYLTRKFPAVHAGPGSAQRVDVTIPEVPLTQWAVLGRVILVIPALVVSSLLAVGQSLLSLVMWIMGTIRSEVPRDLHHTAAVIIRFNVRVSAYVFLLTPQQPFDGFFSDDLVGEEVAPGRSTGSDAAYEHVNVAVSPLVRQLVVVALVLGLAGQAGFVLECQRLSNQSNRLALADATQRIFLKTQSLLYSFVQSSNHCSSVLCRATAAYDDAEAITTAFRAFVKANHFPADVTTNYNAYQLRTQVLIHDLVYTGFQKTEKLQIYWIRHYLGADSARLLIARDDLYNQLAF